jgi:hypothetical protein
MANDQHLTVKDVAKRHDKDPANTGCIWRHPKKQKPCDYLQNSYDACKTRVNVYQRTDYWDRYQATGEGKLDAEARERYRQKAREKSEKKKQEAAREEKRVARLEGDPAQQGRLQKARAALAKARSFSEDAFVAEHEKAYAGAIERLRASPRIGWSVGAIVPANHLQSEKYLGKVGRLVARGKLSCPNHDPHALGRWYPYDHEHHHLIPVGEVQQMLDGPPGPSPVTLADRVEVMVRSKWNVNCRENALILPTDELVARVLQLPAHCPWGKVNHREYSQMVGDQLRDVKRAINDACEDTEKKHEARAKAAARVKALLLQLSADLYRRVTSGGHGGQELGTV